MKIIWFCNMLLPDIARHRKMEHTPFGGWLSGALQALCAYDNTEITVCCPCTQVNEIESGYTERFSYRIFPSSTKKQIRRYGSVSNMFDILLKGASAEIAHIWGTEYSNARVILEVLKDKIPAIVSIQGICSLYKLHYYAGVPEFIRRRYTIRDMIKRDNMRHQYKVFLKISRQEEQTFQLAKHVIGRTQWDRAAISQINPEAQYHFCNEILRPSFFQHRWRLDQCEKHTIFVSQWSSTLKGFHYAIEAFRIVSQKYDDAILYTTGKSPFDMPFYLLTSYQKYIMEQIKRYNLREKIRFTGILDEEQMCLRYLNSHVFVQSSSIENSPNSVGEAMLLGMPIVASYVGGTMDMLRDKEEGFLFQADAPYMMAYYIEQFFEKNDLAKRMGNAAHEHAKEAHNPLRNTQKLMAIYEEVIASGAQ